MTNDIQIYRGWTFKDRLLAFSIRPIKKREINAVKIHFEIPDPPVLNCLKAYFL